MSKCFQTFVLFFCFTAPPLGGVFTAGSSGHTEYGRRRPSRSRGTQRGTPPQRQRRGRESVRGISAPNAAPQPPQPPTRARSTRRARHSRIQLIIVGDYSRDPAAIGWAYTQRRRRAINSRFPALPRSGRGGAKPPAPYERPPIQCHIIAGGGGSLGGLGGAAGGGAAKKSPPR